MKILYKKLAKYYDLIYQDKLYDKETRFVQVLIKKYGITGKRVLDVGCGTGRHAAILNKKGFDVVGVDLNKEMLNIAKKKNKRIKFLQGNMRTFNLKEEFDIILCLFSTIHYARNYEEIRKTLKNFYKHLRKGGILIFDMGMTEEIWAGSRSQVVKKSAKSVELVRFSVSRRENNFAILGMAYVLYKNKKFYFESEEHKLGIFKTLKIKEIAEKTGFSADLYNDFSNKKWNAKSKRYVVFACVKK